MKRQQFKLTDLQEISGTGNQKERVALIAIERNLCSMENYALSITHSSVLSGSEFMGATISQVHKV